MDASSKINYLFINLVSRCCQTFKFFKFKIIHSRRVRLCKAPVTTDRTIFLSLKIYKIVVVALSCKTSKKIVEWSHQLRHVHDGSTMAKWQKKNCYCIVVGLSQVGCATVVRQSWVVLGFFFQVFMSWDAHVTVVSLSYDCRTIVMCHLCVWLKTTSI